MGLPSRSDYSNATHDPKVVPIHPPEPSAIAMLPVEKSELEEYGHRAGELLGEATERISRAYSHTWLRLSDTYAEIAFRAREIASSSRIRVEQFKEERPLQLLGIIAGMAFAAGVAVRVWRSRRS
jgi:ElaB/YqjD/DUF883 family membrane-anchored ribosome-binding protein